MNIEVAPDLKADKSILNIQKFDGEPLMHCNALALNFYYYLI